MKILHVKPALLDGKPMVIRDPATGQPMPPHGKSVPASPFWTTALRVGDVVQTTAAEIEAAEVPGAADKKADKSTRAKE